MVWRDLVGDVNAAVMDAFGEGDSATLDGHPVAVIINDEPYSATGLSIDVSLRAPSISILTSEARRIDIRKGMAVEMDEGTYEVLDFVHDRHGMTRVELS